MLTPKGPESSQLDCDIHSDILFQRYEIEERLRVVERAQKMLTNMNGTKVGLVWWHL